jgi:hypothetical protein
MTSIIGVLIAAKSMLRMYFAARLAVINYGRDHIITDSATGYEYASRDDIKLCCYSCRRNYGGLGNAKDKR